MVLGWVCRVCGAEVDVAAEDLRRRLADAPPDQVRCVALLLWAAAGYRPLVGSNLMDFGLSHRRSRAVHRLASSLLDAPPLPSSASCRARSIVRVRLRRPLSRKRRTSSALVWPAPMLREPVPAPVEPSTAR